MAIFRQYIAPLLVVIIFTIALIAVSARIFLPGDMRVPAPVSAPDSAAPSAVAPESPDETPDAGA